MSTQVAGPHPGGSQLGEEAPAGAPRQSGRSLAVWALISFVAVARVVAFVLLKPDAGHTLVPRSFVGGGFQSRPALLDVIVPLAVIVALFSRERFAGSSPRWWKDAGADAITFLLFPIAAGLTMFAYEGAWQIVPNVTWATVLRWLQFVGAYVAWNLLLDALPGRRQRLAAAGVLAVCLGLSQDIYPGFSNPLLVLFSVGLTLAWTVLALRRRYAEAPLAATAAAAVIGGVSCLLVVMAPSDSAFVFLLSLLALPLGALAVRTRRPALKWGSLAAVAAAGLVLSLVVPRFQPPEKRADFLTQEPPPLHTEQVEGIAVSYDDVRVRAIAREMAHVLAAANQVSRDVYGVSPEANALVIRGFAAGGFHADFPHAIFGNFVSPKQVELSLDSAFLNGAPATSITFPDPVNALLHEYSHLYGVVPYMPWLMGTEDEGWATFSATRLSHRLYERYGPGLWSPAYDYAARADAITTSTLAGHAVCWSHPNEYAGFRLWSAASGKMGEAQLYRARWDLTLRRYSWGFQVSDPAAARRVADRFGFANLSLPAVEPERYGRLYSLQEIEAAGASWGRPVEQIRREYARRANIMIDPRIRMPARGAGRLDLVLSLVAAGVLVFAANRSGGRLRVR